MTTVKELKEHLNNLEDHETIFIGYSDDDELNCTLWTENQVIDEANIDLNPNDSKIVEIETALEVLAGFEEDYHYMDIKL